MPNSGHNEEKQWQNVVKEMPMGMTKWVNTIAVNEKVIYIYTCFNGVDDKVMLLQRITCFRYIMLINVNMSNCKYAKCMNVVR